MFGQIYLNSRRKRPSVYRNELYEIRDQRPKRGGIMREHRPGISRSQAAGSGSIVFRGDQGSSIPTENVEMRFNWRDLPPFKNLSCIFSVTICSGTKPYVTRFAGQA